MSLKAPTGLLSDEVVVLPAEAVEKSSGFALDIGKFKGEPEGTIMGGVHGHSETLAGWVYYHISNAMQYSIRALGTTALVMQDSNMFFQGGGGGVGSYIYSSVNIVICEQKCISKL